MKNPKISIVLPTYNGARFLSDSIESIIAQTERDWELIIVNDCSTDDTLKIANKYATQDSRISVVSNRTNKKLPASLNVGFALARGKYLTWTSDDNIYHIGALKKMAAYLDENKSADMVSFDINFVNENTLKIRCTLAEICYGRNQKQLAMQCNIGAAFMYRREIAEKIGKYDEQMFCAEDYDYWCRIALHGRIDYVDEVIYDYRENSASITATQKARVQEQTTAIWNKYCDSFCKIMTDREIMLLKYNNRKWPFSLSSLPVKYKIGYALLKIRQVVVKTLFAILLFWNKKLQHKICHKLLVIKFDDVK